MKNIPYPSLHTHTDISNIRLLDSTNKGPESVIDYAIEIGLNGLAITDHDCLGSHIKALKHYKKIKENNIDFKVMLGNEIYLLDDRNQKKRFHFLLIAKDLIGYNVMKELSSKAWSNSFEKGRMTVVPSYKNEVTEIINKNKGHLIASTACLGGELPYLILELDKLEKSLIKNEIEINFIKQSIMNFIKLCLDWFGEDFYFEIQPSSQKDQVIVNKKLKQFSELFGIKIIVTTDAHYLNKDLKSVHRALLTSKEGDRETSSFYEATYLMTSSEIMEFKSIKENFTEDEMISIFNNTNEILGKVKDFDLYQKQEVPKVNIDKDLKKLEENLIVPSNLINKYLSLKNLLNCDNHIRKFWLLKCIQFLQNKELINKEEYLERLDIEANELIEISKKVEDDLFAYYVTMSKIIEICWDKGDSFIGPARGSATGFLSCYCLQIIQIDPIVWELPYWRHLSSTRPELPDIDFDTQASRRRNILLAIKEFFGTNNVLNIATYGTIATKSACKTAVRGYRSEEYPDGLDVEVGDFLSSMIPTERGFLWSLSDVIFGNEEKDRKPIKMFINEVNKYEGLLDIIKNIEGVIDKRSIHASGIYIYNDGFLEHNAMMRAPNGQEITQFNMEDSDYMGGLKFDFLTVEALDCERVCIDLLMEDGLIEQESTLRETYNRYLHPDVLDYKNQNIWNLISEDAIINLFQFSTPIGSQAVKKIRPQNLVELAQVNSLMRLMAEKGNINPIDKFVKFKQNINLWYNEMRIAGLNEEEVKILEPHLLKYYGVGSTQEVMMIILMDKNLSNFDIPLANKARKAVAKKKASLMEEVKEIFYKKCEDNGKRKVLANYVWENVIMPQAGYSFSLNHTTPYSIIALQEATLYNNYPSIYWNTACLSVNAGAAEEFIDESFKETEEDDEDEDLEEEEQSKTKSKKKAVTADYGKIAKAIGEMREKGILIVPPNINISKFDFRPDVDNNRIIFGFMGLNRIGKDLINLIIEQRPFSSMSNFFEKVKINKPQTLSLIKSGAFDELENKPREEILKDYITLTAGLKTKLDLKNLAGLIEKQLIPEDKTFYVKLFNFNKYIKQKHFKVIPDYLIIDNRASDYLLKNFTEIFDKLELKDSGILAINLKLWEKTYTKTMKVLSLWLKENQEEVLEKFNKKLFEAEWNKYCKGNISHWEMESMCYYYHDHELADINLLKYGISEFNKLPEVPEIERTFSIKGRTIPIYELTKIVGTVIKKEKVRGSFTLLTTDGVVDVRLNNELFSIYDKRLTAPTEDGRKKIMEDSWFKRGNKLMVLGFRREDQFVPKKYKNSIGHRLSLITKVLDNGDIEYNTERWKAN